MSLTINTNPTATAAAFGLSHNNMALQKSLTRLSSGQRIVESSDDAGGLAVSMRLSAQANRIQGVRSNVTNALSFMQVQDGALKTAGSIVDRMSELRTLADDVMKNTSDIANYNVEFQQLRQQLDNVTGEKFNGVSLFGDFGGGGATFGTTLATASKLNVYTSSDGAATGAPVVEMGKVALQSALQIRGASAAGATIVGTTYDSTTNLSATSADTTSISSFSVSDLTQALENVATLRAENGGISSRLQFSSQNLESRQSNIEAANSRIIDTDIATESSRFARLNIKTQASASMLAQANALQGIALSLLG